jgi:hypothetical protein
MSRKPSVTQLPQNGPWVLMADTPGPERVMVSWTPYWNQYMYERMTGERIDSTIFE